MTTHEFTFNHDSLPRSVDAEAACIGAMMIDNDLIAPISLVMKPSDMFEPLHQRLYKAILKFHEAGRNVNPVSLKPIFERDTALIELGGIGYLASLTGNGLALIGAVDFARQIADLAQRREAMQAFLLGASDLADLSEDDDVLSTIARVEGEVRAATERSSTVQVRSVKTATETVRRRYEETEKLGANAIGARCRTIEDIETLLGPVERGTFNIIGGRPGQAKTASSVSMALGFAANGFATEYIHPEMSGDQLDMRVVSDLSHALGMPITHDAIKRGRLGSNELQILDKIDEMQEMLPVNFTKVEQGVDVSEIEAIIVRAKRKWEKRRKKLWVVFVDYLQIVGASSNGRPLEKSSDRVTAVCKALNAMKDKHDVAIFALCQLSRAVEDRKDKRPQLNDLKDSGQIEQDADSVMFVHRPEYYLLQEKPAQTDSRYEDWEKEWQISRDRIELIGAKNRHGNTATAKIRFYPEYYAVRSSASRTDGLPVIERDLFADGCEIVTDF